MKANDRMKLEELVDSLFNEIDRTPYGAVGVRLTIHDGQVRRIEFRRQVSILVPAASSATTTDPGVR